MATRKPSKNFGNGPIREISFPIDEIKCRIIVGLGALVHNYTAWAMVPDVVKGIIGDEAVIDSALNELHDAGAIVRNAFTDYESKAKVDRVSFGYKKNLARVAECRRLLATKGNG